MDYLLDNRISSRGWLGKMNEDPEEYEKLFEEYTRRGFNHICLHRRLDPQQLKNITEFLKSRNWMDRVFIGAPFDEIHRDFEPPYIKWAKKWKQVSPIKRMLTCYYPDPVNLYGYVDVWTRPLEKSKLVEERRKAGDQFWMVNPGIGMCATVNLLGGRKDFWRIWEHDYDGFLLWRAANWYGQPWKPGSAANWDAVFLYPDQNGFIPSLRMTVMRDGIDDYDYLIMLEKAAEKVISREGEIEPVIRAQAIYQNKELTEKIKNIRQLESLRQEISDLIEELNRISK